MVSRTASSGQGASTAPRTLSSHGTHTRGIDVAAERQRYFGELLASDPGSLSSEPERLHSLSQQQKRALEECIATHGAVYLSSQTTREELVGLLRECSAAVTSLEEEEVPALVGCAKAFKGRAAEENARRESLKGVLESHDALLDILEIPSLMETCVRAGKYEAALELKGFLERMRVIHGVSDGRGEERDAWSGNERGPHLLSVVYGDVERVCLRMKEQLLEALERDVQLPACYQLVGTLKRVMGGDGWRDGEGGSLFEVQREFLERRGRWVDACVGEAGSGMVSGGRDVSDHVSVSITSGSAAEYVKKLTDVYRLQVADVLTQYRVRVGVRAFLSLCVCVFVRDVCGVFLRVHCLGCGAGRLFWQQLDARDAAAQIERSKLLMGDVADGVLHEGGGRGPAVCLGWLQSCVSAGVVLLCGEGAVTCWAGSAGSVAVFTLQRQGICFVR